ncbi:MAG: SDR family oxidoreductase [Betaproteobacteria bacterium]|nr:SDR family oxidoreductase [Betaproteobacteria bacterium]
MHLKGKHALVTGSTSGIGLGIAEGLAKEGVNLVLNGFGDADAIEALRDRLARQYAVQVIYDGADMSQGTEIARMMAEVAAKTGGIDILVNNAGIQHVSPVEDFPEAKWDAILAINLSSAFHTTKAAMPYAQPTKRFVSVEQIAATTLFLCSDAAASITGSHIAVEGGWVAQ